MHFFVSNKVAGLGKFFITVRINTLKRSFQKNTFPQYGFSYVFVNWNLRKNSYCKHHIYKVFLRYEPEIKKVWKLPADVFSIWICLRIFFRNFHEDRWIVFLHDWIGAFSKKSNQEKFYRNQETNIWKFLVLIYLLTADHRLCLNVL